MDLFVFFPSSSFSLAGTLNKKYLMHTSNAANVWHNFDGDAIGKMLI